MPTRPEMLVQLEAGLRSRFFASVPKITKTNRQGWAEDQHDLDRLSRALAAYTIVRCCRVDDAVAVGAITDGSDDHGLDALFFDRARGRLVCVQSKFKRTGAAPSQEEVQKTINGLRALRARRFNEFNEAVRNRLDEIEEALETPGIRIELHMSFLGDAMGPHAMDDLNGYAAELNPLSLLFEWHTSGLGVVYNWLALEQAAASVDDQVVLENWAGVNAPRKAVYGQIRAAALAGLVENHGQALFERNIRLYLGTVGVNAAITRTVREAPNDFFYLNNGITIVAESIAQAQGDQRQCTFALTNCSIVNGAQTAGAIATATLDGHLSQEAKLMVTIIEIGGAVGDLEQRITKARNHQNVVRGVDFAALDPNQERLRQELAAAGAIYFYRPSAEAFARRDGAFSLEDAAVALACLRFKARSATELLAAEVARRPRPSNAIDFVTTAKKEIGRLWDQGGVLYSQLFPADLSGVRMYRLVKIYRFIDQILAGSEGAESSYQRRMFFRHGRYFIMAFVAHRSADVIEKPQLELSVEEQALLSRRTNQLSELIYSTSEPLQGYKGYLGIFRNLTDAQPLADTVLQRLAAEDAQSMAQPALPPV
ncbi:AIPR family protein [Rhodanobacter sp. Col0626]|uniref:AIPR family protein n=1 Tax=Rhodanobacter sp. Col0626 TaxID=3415679 RepID=UPI003CE95F74